MQPHSHITAESSEEVSAPPSLSPKPASRPWWKRRRTAIMFGLAGIVIVGVILFTLLQPPVVKNTASHNRLLKTLYASALAESLPDDGTTTLWQVTEQTLYGPQGKLCTNYSGPEYKPTRSIFFKQGNITAWYQMAGYPAAEPLMKYSEDKAVPAFADDVFSANQSSAVRSMLANTTATDSKGTPLPADATAQPDAKGIVDIYAHLPPGDSVKRKAAPGCEDLMIHVAIDTKHDLYTQIDVYNKSVAPDNLSFSVQRDITTSSVSFAEALPVLQTAGFDLERAKQEAKLIYSQIVNTEAGFQLDYLKAVAGEPILTTPKDNAGVVMSYDYTFSEQPSVLASVRTAASTAHPASIAAMRTEAKAKGWNITTDGSGDDSNVPGCKAGDSEHNFVAESPTTKYILLERTCGSYPVVYIEYPRSLILYQKMLYMEPLPMGPIGGFGTFAPGTKPYVMH